MKRIRTVIVDDEPLARERIRSLLASEDDIDIVAECDGGEAAVVAIMSERPDLVFLDIQMPDIDGFEVVQLIGAPSMPEVIFVTAFDQYAVRAFEASATDYLLKPFENARFRSALARARDRLAVGAITPTVDALLERLESEPWLSRIVVRKGSRYRILPVGEIDWIEVTGNVLTVHADKQSYVWRGTLALLETRLDPDRFIRIHRSTMVNGDRVRTVEPWNTEFLLILGDGIRLTSSRTYRPRVRAWLNNTRLS